MDFPPVRLSLGAEARSGPWFSALFPSQVRMKSWVLLADICGGVSKSASSRVNEQTNNKQTPQVTTLGLETQRETGNHLRAWRVRTRAPHQSRDTQPGRPLPARARTLVWKNANSTSWPRLESYRTVRKKCTDPRGPQWRQSALGKTSQAWRKECTGSDSPEEQDGKMPWIPSRAKVNYRSLLGQGNSWDGDALGVSRAFEEKALTGGYTRDWKSKCLQHKVE